MIAQGPVRARPGRRMGHISMAGPTGVDGGLRRPWRRRGASTCTSTTPTPSCATTAPSAPRSSAPAGRSPSTAWRSACERACMSPDELEAAIREVGAERYHDKHPFHRLLHGGKLDKGQVQAWALNRYCYQSGVPRKDAALMSRAARPRAAPRMGRTACWTTTASAARRAASSAGWCSPRRWGSTAPTSSPCKAPCRRPGSPSRPTSASCASARCWRRWPPR